MTRNISSCPTCPRRSAKSDHSNDAHVTTGETPAYTGVDFIIARDGKIAALYVYLDSPPYIMREQNPA